MLKKIKKFYESKYKTLLIIPFLVLLLAIAQIAIQTSQTGDFVNKGISLKGGSSIIIYETFSDNQIVTLENTLIASFPSNEFEIRELSSAGKMIGIAVDTDVQDAIEIEKLNLVIQDTTSIDRVNFSVEVVGSSLGESFFTQTMIALLIAFALMGIVVFFYFRSFIPSVAVILAAFSDIVVTLAIFNMTGEKLSTAGVAAFLMLIGYSVDTDILLSTRVLKKKEGTVMDRIYGAMQTGLTMSATTLSAILIAFLLVKSEIVKQIMLILFIGLLVDLLMTWIQNVGILRLYTDRKAKQEEKKE